MVCVIVVKLPDESVCSARIVPFRATKEYTSWPAMAVQLQELVPPSPYSLTS